MALYEFASFVEESSVPVLRIRFSSYDVEDVDLIAFNAERKLPPCFEGTCSDFCRVDGLGRIGTPLHEAEIDHAIFFLYLGDGLTECVTVVCRGGRGGIVCQLGIAGRSGIGVARGT